jgi:hypothetical protein
MAWTLGDDFASPDVMASFFGPSSSAFARAEVAGPIAPPPYFSADGARSRMIGPKERLRTHTSPAGALDVAVRVTEAHVAPVGHARAPTVTGGPPLWHQGGRGTEASEGPWPPPLGGPSEADIGARVAGGSLAYLDILAHGTALARQLPPAAAATTTAPEAAVAPLPPQPTAEAWMPTPALAAVDTAWGVAGPSAPVNLSASLNRMVEAVNHLSASLATGGLEASGISADAGAWPKL